MLLDGVLLFVHSRVDRNPIYLPGLAAVSREKLLELAGFWFDVRDNEAHQDRASVEILLIVKFAPAVTEFANRRRAERARFAARKIQTPLVRLRIIQAQIERLDVSGSVDLQFHQIGAAVPDFSHDRRAVVLQPFVRPAQRLLQSPQVCVPGSKFPIEIMLPTRVFLRERADCAHDQQQTQKSTDHLRRLNVINQFASQVRPLSPENACSK